MDASYGSAITSSKSVLAVRGITGGSSSGASVEASSETLAASESFLSLNLDSCSSWALGNFKQSRSTFAVRYPHDRWLPRKASSENWLEKTRAQQIKHIKQANKSTQHISVHHWTSIIAKTSARTCGPQLMPQSSPSVRRQPDARFQSNLHLAPAGCYRCNLKDLGLKPLAIGQRIILHRVADLNRCPVI